MRAEGLLTVNPSHPQLLALLAQGCQVGEFVEAARDAVGRGKDFRYALGVAQGRRRDAEQLACDARSSAAGKRRYVPAPTTAQMEVDMRVGLRNETGTWLGPRTEDGTPDYEHPEVKSKLQTVAA